jgi:hypothetical protein
MGGTMKDDKEPWTLEDLTKQVKYLRKQSVELAKENSDLVLMAGIFFAGLLVGLLIGKNSREHQ